MRTYIRNAGVTGKQVSATTTSAKGLWTILDIQENIKNGTWPSSNVDQYYSSVKNLLHFDGSNGSTTFTDQKGASWSAAGNAQLSTAQFKFGTASLYLDGSGDSITTTYVTSSHDWWTTDFTLECWVRYVNFTGASVGSTIPTLIGNMTPGTNYWSFGANTSGELYFYYWTGGQNSISSGLTLSSNTWYHIAFTKASDGARIFKDGVKASGHPVSIGSPQSSSGVPLRIGDYGGTCSNVYVDDLRITKGVCRYTSDFTPPITAFPNA